MRLHTPRISGSLAVSSSVLTIDTLGSVSGSATSTGSFGRTEIGGELSVDAMSIPVLSTMSSSVATRFDSRETDMTLATASIALNESNMTLATASIAAITASISRLDDTESNMTLATASIAAITASVSTINDNMTLATASIAAITASVATLKSNVGQELNTDSNVTFGTITSGDINSTGTITATEIHTTFVSSSITVSSGSNIFGDSTDDIHQMTGSLKIGGDITSDTALNGLVIDLSKDTSAANSNQIITGADIGVDVIAIKDIHAAIKGVNINVSASLTDDGSHTNSLYGMDLNVTPYSASNETVYGVKINVDDNTTTATDYGLHVTAATNYFSGNVGIGTTSPDGPLHVFVSDVGVTAGADADDFVIENNASSADVGMSILSKNTRSGLIFFGDGDSATVGRIQYTHAGNYMRFDAAGSEIMRISGSGEVGIGDTSPDALLSIKGDSNGDSMPSIRLKDGSDTREAWISNYSGDLILANGGNDNTPHCKIQMYDGNIISFLTANTERMRIASDGKVGIGTNNPQETLHIESSANTSVRITETGGGQVKLFAPGGGFVIRGEDTNGYTRFDLNVGGSNTEIMRVTTNGLTFNGDTADANALDDYEEGEYDVTVTGGTSGGFNMQSNEEAASYTKIGDLVHVQGGVQIASENSCVGNIRFSLPFTSANTTDFSERSYGTVWLVNTGTTNSGHLVAVNNGNAAYFEIGQVADDGSNTYLTNANVDTAWFLGFQITYKV